MKCEEFKTLKYEVHVNNIYKFNHFHKNGTLLRYKDQLVNAVQKNCLFCKSYETHKYTLGGMQSY
jgi:hypothetical protein